jgi:ATPase subunit of ABC transporter with duplicated ATPase domains
LLVSHDRYLIDSLASQIWEVNPLTRILSVFAGSYSEYKASFVQQTEKNINPADKSVLIADEKSAPPAKQGSGLSSWKRQKKLQEIESKIGRHEDEMKRLSELLANPPADSALVQQAGVDFVRLEKETAHLMDEWGRLAEE